MARADVDAEFGGLPAAPYSRRIIADDFFDDDGKAKRTGKKSYSTLRSISSFDVVISTCSKSHCFTASPSSFA
jgi:hypothetical protein